jgi:16S rRNA (guanine527-N7)-methyltransferase
MRSYGPQDFARDLGVSRETTERLSTHLRLLRLWAPRINLVGPSELEHYWRRHALDCAQLQRIEPDALRWIDLGSGAGFPGLIVACMLAETPGAQVDLVEPNQKRVAFLREAVRETGAPARVLPVKAEDAATADAAYDVVTARAFAPLPRIIASAKPILDRGARGLFLKGAEFRIELAAAVQEGWRFKVEEFASMSDPAGRVLRIEGVARVDSTD